MMPPRIARVLCACCLLTATTAVSYAQLSEKIRAEVVAPFPKFVPPPADQPASPTTTAPAPLSDDPLVQLPDYLIKEKRVQDKDPDLWLSQRAINRKAMSEYSDSMTDLEWALNSWYIPGVTPRPRDLANARYANNKMINEQKRLTSIAQALSRLDSAEAKKLLRDLDLSQHPGK
jgi:hypothetical protein